MENPVRLSIGEHHVRWHDDVMSTNFPLFELSLPLEREQTMPAGWRWSLKQDRLSARCGWEADANCWAAFQLQCFFDLEGQVRRVLQ